ncbi:MAG: AMIN domain-containing protein [Rhizobiales bacterium]|nr:AMIN domain-containing protein [Hyphomicrobiales bacterium]
MRPFHMARFFTAAVTGLVFAASLAWPAGAQPKAVADDVAIITEDGVTRFELSLDRDLAFSVFALADPYRVIIDLPETEFEITTDAAGSASGLISAFRFGLFSPGKSRIVIDTTGPISIAEPVIHKPSADRPARLVVELTSISREVFLRDFAMNGISQQIGAPPPTVRETIVPQAQRQRNPKPVIVIDPGHGGVDPGAGSRSGAKEKHLVLEFAKDLAKKLRATGQFKVVLTRSTDVFVRLDRRRQIARESRADLFVSVHADSIRMSGIRGATVYTVSEKASDEEAAALAAQENRADLIAGIQLEDISDEVSDILIDLARRNTKKRSIDFAKVLVNKMRSNVKLNRNPHRSASFVVLKSADVPSVLLELGYLSNQQDETALRSSKWRTKATSSVLGAVSQFFAPRLAENQ